MFKKKIIWFLLLGSLVNIEADDNMQLKKGLFDIMEEAQKEDKEAKKIFNHLFKQRLRTQLIARDAILIGMDLNISFYKKEMLKNAKNFDSNLTKMLEFKKEIEKLKKLYPKLNDEIDDLNQTWAETYKHVKHISTKEHTQKDLDFIEEHDNQLLKEYSHILKALIETHESHNKLEASISHQKDVLTYTIGLPRAFFTKLVKDRLLIKIHLQEKKNLDNLQKDIKELDRLMTALKNGDKELGLIGTENKEILKKLSISQKIWEETKEILLKKSITKKDIILLIDKNSDFIKAHTEVVKLTKEHIDN